MSDPRVLVTRMGIGLEFGHKTKFLIVHRFFNRQILLSWGIRFGMVKGFVPVVISSRLLVGLPTGDGPPSYHMDAHFLTPLAQLLFYGLVYFLKKFVKFFRFPVTSNL